jgi:hypothetical protein
VDHGLCYRHALAVETQLYARFIDSLHPRINIVLRLPLNLWKTTFYKSRNMGGFQANHGYIAII